MNSGFRTALAVFLTLFGIGFFCSLYFPGIVKLELSAYDAKLRSCSEKFKKESPILIADIDNESIDALPNIWPWPRNYYAKLIDNLNKAGVRLIVIDVMFDKPNAEKPAGDSAFADALRRNRNVILSAEDNHGIGLIQPYIAFNHASDSSWGFINIQEGADRIVREYYYGITDKLGSRHGSLAVETFKRVSNVDLTNKDDVFPIAYFGGERSFEYVSFRKIIDDSTFKTKDEIDFGEEVNEFENLLNSGLFKDKIVFVGASVEDLHDRLFTPYASVNRGEATGSGIPGVEVHAAALHTLMNGNLIRTVPLNIYWIVLLVLSALIFFAGSHMRILYTSLLVAIVLLISVVANVVIFRLFLIQLPVMPILITVAITYAGQQAFLFYQERKKRRQITGMFGHYVPKEVVSELIRDPGKMKLGGERRELTVLFSDIAGFTTLSENMEPEKLITLLNEYLTEMTAIVHKNGGIIDKYEGDAIMAEFGIPILMPDHALRACTTAFEMQKRLYELGQKWTAEGKPVLTARVGIGTGNMVFGNMGSDKVFDYTVIGDVVNLTSRLEGANKVYGTKIIINEAAFLQSSNDIFARELDLIRVKGKVKPVKCYQLMAPKNSPKADEIANVIDTFTKGLKAYRAQDWHSAIIKFNETLSIWPDDGPSKAYIERSERLIRVNPGRGWDGVFSQTTK
ncbi:MAG: adenylate/guanylate cyclase domain-containing protein [Fibrobacteres bacterium]|nr:adenylate/guanylate cyclase domain-containing protein [Fibrobacterota bacterium]